MTGPNPRPKAVPNQNDPKLLTTLIRGSKGVASPTLETSVDSESPQSLPRPRARNGRKAQNSSVAPLDIPALGARGRAPANSGRKNRWHTDGGRGTRSCMKVWCRTCGDNGIKANRNRVGREVLSHKTILAK